MGKYNRLSEDPVERLLGELHHTLEAAHVEEHLRPRAVLAITKAYEDYWSSLGRRVLTERSAAVTDRAAELPSEGGVKP